LVLNKIFTKYFKFQFPGCDERASFKRTRGCETTSSEWSRTTKVELR